MTKHKILLDNQLVFEGLYNGLIISEKKKDEDDYFIKEKINGITKLIVVQNTPDGRHTTELTARKYTIFPPCSDLDKDVRKAKFNAKSLTCYYNNKYKKENEVNIEGKKKYVNNNLFREIKQNEE